jgi:Uma2 family endonuclease
MAIRPSEIEVDESVRSLGPRDAGRIMSEEAYLRCEDAPGCFTEIIDGVVQVSPSPKPVHDYWQNRIVRFLNDYAGRHPEIINFVATDNDVVIPIRPGPTRPRPDVTAYRDFPDLVDVARQDDWRNYCPILVVEVMSRRRPWKVANRNRQLYWTAGGIAEYWLIDPRKRPSEPLLRIFVREQGQPDWVEHEVAFGEAWESKHLPGLRVNLRDLR